MILELKNICSGYLNGVDVVHNINLQLEEGSATALLGLNGAGKSTLCQAIMNMNPVRSGEVCFDGRDVTKLSTGELSQLGISFFMSSYNTFPELSVWENMQIAAGDRKAKEIDEIRMIFPVLSGDKKALKRKMADKLSGGERNQLALAMSILSKAKLLILDEPSAGLSPLAIKMMYEILEQIRQEKALTILLVEQSAELVREFCGEFFTLDNGEIEINNANKNITN